MKVLVIEDDQDYRNLLVRFLNKAFPKATVREYDPGKEGRPGRDFDWSEYDVLLLDYRLGEKDTGLDWLRFYKRASRNFPATILLTAVGSEDLAVRALRYGAHDYLRKQKLNGKKLAESVADAFNMRERESKNESSLTINASRFSKSFFYGQFDLAFQEVEKGKKRAMVLIKTNGYEALLKSLGVLAMDEIEKYMATNALEVFNVGDYRSRATRFMDAYIAILVGDYRDDADLERLMTKLSDHVQKSPPVVNDSPIPIAVVIGAVPILSGVPNVQGILEKAERLVSEAPEIEGNSVLVYKAKSGDRELGDTSERARVFDAKAAFKENRIQAMFRPLTGVSEESSNLEVSELFQINPHFVTRSGEYLRAEKVLTEQADDTLGRVIDRWKIRECVSRILNFSSEAGNAPGFLIELGKGSCSDVNLVRWISELIKHHKKGKRLFRELCLCIPAPIFMTHMKPIATLLGHLQKQHGFRAAIGGVDDPALCQLCFKQFAFDLVVLAPTVVEQIIEKKAKDGIDVEKLVEFVHDKNALTVAGEVQNANDLHGVISAGIDFVYGDFIGPEQEEIEAAIGIESVSLG